MSETTVSYIQERIKERERLISKIENLNLSIGKASVVTNGVFAKVDYANEFPINREDFLQMAKLSLKENEEKLAAINAKLGAIGSLLGKDE